MQEKIKPWPESPKILHDRIVIQRGLSFYFPCAVCREMGWAERCRSKDECGPFLYQRIAEHLKEWELETSKTAGSVRR